MIRRTGFLFPLLAFTGAPLLPAPAEEPRKSLPPLVTRSATLPTSSQRQPPPANTVAPVFIGPPVKVRLWNHTGRGVELVWMNPNGTEQSRGLLPPSRPGSRPAMFDTFGGQLWLFKAEGRVIQVFAAKDQPIQEVQIGLPEVAAGPPTNPTETQIRVERGLILQEPIPAPGPILPPAEQVMPPELEDAPADALEFLRIHNDERARVGVPPLRWSAKLARYAQKWAEHLATTGQFEHRDPSQAKYGENLFRGSDGYSPLDAARLWLEERALYRGGPVPRSDLKTVGHYTQMIWRETTEVGYGAARGRDGLVVVANYAPGGNRLGRKPY